MRRYNAYLTVCMALCLPLILSLCLTLIAGARQNGGRLEAACLSEMALQSVMAEYHRELKNQYDIFAIDSSYGDRVSGKDKVEGRLRFYLEENLNFENILLVDLLYRDFLGLEVGLSEIQGVSMLSDEGGAVFRALAVEAVRENTSLHFLEDINSWIETIEVNGLEKGREEEQRQQVDMEMSAYANEYPELEIKNPTEHLNQKRRAGILKFVTDSETLSGKCLYSQGSIEYRARQGVINQGNIQLPQAEDSDGLTDKFLFQRYLAEKLGHYGDTYENKALDYEQEYVIAGKDSDTENLRVVANRLSLLREAANMLYLWNCTPKRQEALALAEAICTALTLPELSPVMEAAILLGWAYAESLHDVRVLLNGGNVPLIKEDEDWHYSLTSVMNNVEEPEEKEAGGLSYEEYLIIFMMLEDTDVLTMRAMNIIEANIRQTAGNESFRLDACYAGLLAAIRIDSVYGYQYEYKRYRYY